MAIATAPSTQTIESFFQQPQSQDALDTQLDSQMEREELISEVNKKIKTLEKTLADEKEILKMVNPLQVDESNPHRIGEDGQFRDNLALYVQDCFKSSEASRVLLEQDWIAALKQYKGVYDAHILSRFSANRSRAYVRITRTKVKTVDSRLVDLLFPANGDKNWEITPTTLPELSQQRIEALAQMYQQESGEAVTPEKLQSLILDESTRQAKKMSKVISDQLTELRYREIMREVIHSGNVYGTGILKGPLAVAVENRQYYKHKTEGGQEEWLLKDYDRIIPFAENVRIWDIYPDMESTTFADCRYVVQRRKMNKKDLVCLAKRSDFNGPTIHDYLKLFPEGKYEKKAFEVSLQTLGEINTLSDGDLSKSRKYEVLEFWGYVDTHTLEQWGMVIPEDKKGWMEIPCNVWVLGDRVIKAAINPLEGIKWPFFVYYFDKDETSIFGEGIPSIMRTMQEMTNSAFRAMLDNAAISAGPQLEVNLDLISEDEDPREVHPFKVWLRTGQGADAASPCLRPITLPSYTPEFERMLNLFSNYSDEITTIPRYMWGDQSGMGGAGRTSSGLSMLMGSANMAIKDQVKNFDDGITTPFIQAMYHWNMQFNEDNDIKGDYGVVARGSASLIAKEMYTQYLIQFLNITNNPMDTSIIKRPNIIRSIADAFDLKSDQFILDDTEIAAQKQQQQAEQQQQQEFMRTIVETAREEGVSPDAMINAMKGLMDQQEKLLQMQQAQGAQHAGPSNMAINAQYRYRSGAPEEGVY